MAGWFSFTAHRETFPSGHTVCDEHALTHGASEPSSPRNGRQLRLRGVAKLMEAPSKAQALPAGHDGQDGWALAYDATCVVVLYSLMAKTRKIDPMSHQITAVTPSWVLEQENRRHEAVWDCKLGS